MNKKHYQTPMTKMMRVSQQMLCSSIQSNQKNESYEIVDETTTSSWY